MVGDIIVPLFQLITTILCSKNTYVVPSISTTIIMNFQQRSVLVSVPSFNTINSEPNASNSTVFWCLKCQIIGSLPINITNPKCTLLVTTFSTWPVSTHILNHMALSHFSGALVGICLTLSWKNSIQLASTNPISLK